VLCGLQKPRAADVEKHGPHTNRWIMVYANPSAAAALLDATATMFPPGSIIVKQKLDQPTASEPDGTALMIKHAKGEFISSGGWEFRYSPEYHPDQDAKPNYDSCVACHKAGVVSVKWWKSRDASSERVITRLPDLPSACLSIRQVL
jgi:ABC-type transport system substrate-binding protein